MNVTRYLLKHVSFYLLTVLVLLLFYGIAALGLGIEPAGRLQNFCVVGIFLAYPTVRLLYRTIMDMVEYLDPDREYFNENIFARIWEESAPGTVKGKRNRKFIVNMLIRLVEICMLASLAYSFIVDDTEFFKGLAAVTVILSALVLLAVIRLAAREFISQRRREGEELSAERIKAGFPLDPVRRRRFMKRPGGLLAADVFLAVCGILEMALMPVDVASWLYHTGAFVRTLGILALLLMPAAIYFFVREWYRSYMFTVEIGKGEYGQIKVEFWQYEGSGDNRVKTRNKIDRLEVLTVSARYIRIVKVGNLWPVKIPRTMSRHREKELLDTLEIMRPV